MAGTLAPMKSAPPSPDGTGPWRPILDRLPVPAAIMDPEKDLRVEFLNRRFLRTYGYDIDEIRGFDDWSTAAFPSPPYRRKVCGRWKEAVRSARDGGSISGGRCRIVDKGGVARDTFVSGTRVGKRVLVFLVDLAKMRQLSRGVRELGAKAASLSESVARLQGDLQAQRTKTGKILDSMTDPHVILEPVKDGRGMPVDWTVRHANPAACACWKTDIGHAEGRSVREFTEPNHQRGVMAWARDVLMTGEPLAMNDYAYGKTLCGEERRFDIQVSCVDDSVIWSWRDVTERCRAARKILESEEKYRLLAQNSSDVVMLADGNKIVRWISPAISKTLGWEVREWVGRPCTDFFADRDEIEDFDRHRSSVSKNGQREVIRERLRAKDGSVHWVEAHTGPYVDGDGQIDGVVSSFRLIDSQVAAEEELSRRARSDELTKLLNRREALDRLDRLRGQAKRTGHKLAVLFVDFDRFKSVNDTFGHTAGDDVLRALAARIRDCLRTSDDIGARVGGDEMLVVLHGVHDLGDALNVAEKLRKRAAEPVHSGGADIQATVSIGVTLAEPDEKTEVLLARADDAMYRAKTKGRNQAVTISGSGFPASGKAGTGGGNDGQTRSAPDPTPSDGGLTAEFADGRYLSTETLPPRPGDRPRDDSPGRCDAGRAGKRG